MWNFNQFLHSMCSCIKNIDDLSSHFLTFYIFLPDFFQFLQIQVEETFFFHKAIAMFPLRDWTYKQKYNWKVLSSDNFYCCFTYSSNFKHFHIFSSFFCLRRKKPISSRNSSQFSSSNEHVNSNTTVKYQYSAHFCCFINLENYSFLLGKILLIHPFSNFSKSLSQFLPLQVEETYFFQEAIAVSGFTSHGRNMWWAIKYLYSAHFWLLFH